MLLPALILLALACKQGQAAVPGQPPVLDTARAVHSLSVEEARKALPVHIRALVSYYDCTIDVRHCALFVHDRTGSIFVTLPRSFGTSLREGSLIDIEGVTGPGEFAPVVDRAMVTLLGQGAFPYKAVQVTLTELKAGLYDGQWVEMKGMVHSFEVRGANVILHMDTGEGMMGATTLLEPGADYGRLVGATIRLRGNEAPQFNKRGQLTGVHIYFPSLAEVAILRPRQAEPYRLPVQPVDRLMAFVPGQTLSGRTRIRGTVTLNWPGRMLCVQDASGGLCVQNAGGGRAAEGSAVDVAGFPEIADSTPNLTDAIYQGADVSPTVVRPLPLTAKLAMNGEHAGELVEMTGTLISLDAGVAGAPLMVSSDGVEFAAKLDGGAGTTSPAWKQGSRIRLTGVCLAKVDEEGTDAREGGARFASFQLMLRSPDDVAVLQTPSWWTGPHAEMVVGVGALVTVAVLCWVIVLRRRVDQQTLVIRQSEERYRHLALHDTLTGLANRALLHDRLENELVRAQRNGSCFALLMLDLDRFKEVNDSLGHQVGDRLLCAAAERVRASVRKTDTVARIGGDEFVVLLAESGEEPREVGAKIVRAMAAKLVVEGHTVLMSASIGICAYPEGGRTADVLLRNVDSALYEAKAMGRNCLKQFEPVEIAAGALSRCAPGMARMELPPDALAVPAQ